MPSSHTEEARSLIYLQAGGKSPAACIVIQQEQLVTDSTFRGTVGRSGEGGGVPTVSDVPLKPTVTFLFGRGVRGRRIELEKREFYDILRRRIRNS